MGREATIWHDCGARLTLFASDAVLRELGLPPSPAPTHARSKGLRIALADPEGYQREQSKLGTVLCGGVWRSLDDIHDLTPCPGCHDPIDLRGLFRQVATGATPQGPLVAQAQRRPR